MSKQKRKSRKNANKTGRKTIDNQTTNHGRVLLEAEWLPADADPQLLGNAKTQWQLGDWEALAVISVKTMEAHPERATIAMLCAAAHQQLSRLDKTRELMRLARQWGATKEQVVRVMAAGVHNVLGRITALNNLDDRSLGHFSNAVSLNSGDAPSSSYLVKARASAELREQMTLSVSAKKLTGNADNSHGGQNQQPLPRQDSDSACRDARLSWCKGDWQRLVKLDNVSLPDHPQRIMLGIYAACGHQQLGDGEAEQRCIQSVLHWGGDKNEIKRFLLSGIYNRLGKAHVYACNYDEALRYFRKAFDTVIVDNAEINEHLHERIVRQLKKMPKEDLDELLNRL